MIWHYLELNGIQVFVIVYQFLLTDEPEIAEERPKADSKEKRNLKWWKYHASMTEVWWKYRLSHLCSCDHVVVKKQHQHRRHK